MTFIATKLFHKAGEGSGGGGDQHNLGWYATQSALETAHPTANDGDWAIVGSTDTVWVWDSDTTAWKDTDTKGQVTSVNNQTGAVTLTASDVGALPDNTHIPADPVQADWSQVDSSALDYIKNKPTIPAAQVNSDWNANSGVAQILNKPTIPDAIQTGTMPTASADELGKVYQFIGTTDANYTHGYFYECVSDGGNPATYSWSNVQVQASSGGLPSQTGQSGKFLTTDGTDASWSDKPLVNKATGTNSLTILGTATTRSSSINIGNNSRAGGTYSSSCLAVGNTSVSTGNYSVALGNASEATGNGAISLGYVAKANGEYSLAIGELATVSANNAIQINAALLARTNSDANTLKVGNANGNYEIMSADGTIPTARLTKVNTTVTLVAADWSSNTQTVSVTGMTATGVVLVSPDPTDQSAYTSAGIICSAQAAGTLTFTCSTTPVADLSVNVVML